MGRASKFSFPLPGRRAHGEREEHLEPAAAPDHDYQPPSKAERLLGTGLPGRRTGSQASASFPRNNYSTPSLDTKKSYMNITLSEAIQDSAGLRKGSLPANVDHLVPPHPRFHQDHSSRSKDRSPSVTSSTYSGQLNSQGSSSTLRSHYDAHRQPLHVSQQTSMSAVRDGGLRKGHPALHSSQSLDQESLHGSVRSGDMGSASSTRKSHKKKKKTPARLDLSKLFPKAPKSKDHNNPHLLSPTQFVSSPSAMSSTSTHFSRPLTSPTATHSNTDRAPSVASSKTSDTLREGRAQAAKDRAYKSQFDNAKVNRRRPPPGIQHWFDGISDDEEEEEEEEDEQEQEIPPVRASVRAQESRPQPSPHDHRRRESPSRHGRKTSHNKLAPGHPSYPAHEHAYGADRSYASKRGYPNEPPVEAPSYRPFPSNYQIGGHGRSSDKPRKQSQTSLASQNTAWTNTSKISGRDLKGDSVLSLSSSEDESDPRGSGTSLPIIRDSIATESEGEILIGKAQAFDIRPRQNRSGRRMTSASGMSVQSSATGTTIDIMLSPTTAASSQTNLLLPRHSISRSSRGSRHSRQVSAIPEDQDTDSKSYTESISNASFDDKDTNSIRSARTSRSEPRHMGHKLMAVTEEEEVLLELMRRKRAAMAKQSFTDGYRSAIKAENAWTRSPTPDHQHHFMSMDSPISEYMREQSLKENDRRHSKKSLRSQTTLAETEASLSTLETLSSATYVPPSRSEKKNRPPPMANEALLRSPASSSITSSPRSRPIQRIMSQAPQLSPALFSPLGMFPSPPDSPIFPATASHTGTIPSPVTPGPGPGGELPVKVAGSSIGGSEASFGTDQDSLHNVHPHHHHHPSDYTLSHKGKERARREETDNVQAPQSIDRARSHSRRRTASSGANVDPCAEPAAQPAASNNFIRPPRTSSYMAFPSPPIAIQRDEVDSISSGASSKGRIQPGLAEWDWDVEADVGAVINKVRKARSSHILGSSRTSASSTAPAPSTGTAAKRLSRQSSIKSHMSSKSAAKSEAGDRPTVAPMSNAAIAQRSSVCDDVLAAWSSLGGSRVEF